jgi:dTDP-4-amino-4,6-dideoxygalactose transaminase
MSDDTSDAEMMAIAHGLTIMKSPHDITRAFEAELCRYTGAKYAVTTTSCTMALTLALAWDRYKSGTRIVRCPRNTYIGVPSAILNAGHRVGFRAGRWTRQYHLVGNDEVVTDCAWRLEPEMYVPGDFQCLSFHWTKPLGLGQGGAILHDSDDADEWLRRARFDGRKEGVHPRDDVIQYPNWHAYMSPETATTGLMRLQAGAIRTNHVATWKDYPDISQQEAFKP